MLEQKIKKVVEACNKIELDLESHWCKQRKEEKDSFRVLNITGEPKTFALIKNRLKMSDSVLNDIIAKLVKEGFLEAISHRHAQNRSKITRYVNTIGKRQSSAVRRLCEFILCPVGYTDTFDFRHHWVGRAVSFEIQDVLRNVLGMYPDKEFKIDYTAEKLIIITRIK
jgi:DNA-binding MarR family transcriptional regulator